MDGMEKDGGVVVEEFRVGDVVRLEAFDGAYHEEIGHVGQIYRIDSNDGEEVRVAVEPHWYWPAKHVSLIRRARHAAPVDADADVSRTAEVEAALDLVLEGIRQEVLGAMGKHARFNSAHEGYAVILEELDELKAEVWKKRAARDKARMQEEAVQVAAMAVRFVLDVI